eukprot:comp23385_c0_seq1/m.38731 comp23385_c0_seq1/g.38731  ORF comp23385_c0_seq1/g.38731 comp23385_c0_seq1/m.38731 type:complete len:835 (-) comp23385_c0_seq1:723-3227(-)
MGEDSEPLVWDQGDPDQLYTDSEDIGHGSFGAVVRATDVRTGNLVAIKKIPRGKKDKDDMGDVSREIKILRDAHHPHIVGLVATHFKANVVWIAMEYCEASAADILQIVPGGLVEPEIGAILLHVLKAVSWLHSRGMIHRDLKASNILLSADGNAKLGDFGSASLKDTANTFVGTPYWMAPEVITAMEEGTYSTKADIWSLGITCIELAEKKPPLMHLHAMTALYQIPHADPPTLKDPDNWSPSLTSFTTSCLLKEPSERWTADQLLQHPLIAAFGEGSTAISLIGHLLDRRRKELDARQAQQNRYDDTLLTVGDRTPRSSLVQSPTLELDDGGIVTAACVDFDEVEPQRNSTGLSPALPRPNRLSRESTGGSVNVDPALPLTDRAQLRAQHLVNKHLDVMREQCRAKLKAKDDIHDMMGGRYSWRGHQKAMKKVQDAHRKQRGDCEKAQEKELLELGRSHEAAMNKLVANNAAEAERMATRHRNEVEALGKAEVAERKAFLKRMDAQAKQAWKEQEGKKKAAKKRIKDEEIARSADKTSMQAKRTYKAVWEKECVEIESALTRHLADVRQAEEVTMEQRLAQARTTLAAQHQAEVQQYEEKSRRQVYEQQLLACLEVAEAKTRHLTALYAMLQGHAAKTQGRDREWLAEAQAAEVRAMQRAQAEEQRMRPKLKKLFKVSLQRQNNDMARAVQSQLKSELQAQVKANPKDAKQDIVRSFKEVELQRLTDMAAEFDNALVLAVDLANSRLDAMQMEEIRDMERRHKEAIQQIDNFSVQKQAALQAQRQKQLSDLLQASGQQLDAILAAAGPLLTDTVATHEARLRNAGAFRSPGR